MSFPNLFLRFSPFNRAAVNQPPVLEKPRRATQFTCKTTVEDIAEQVRQGNAARLLQLRTR